MNTVEPVSSGHPRGMAKWPLNTRWLPITGCKKYSSKNSICSADHIRCFTSNRNINFWHFNDLRKQTRKSIVVPHVLHYLKQYEQVIDTMWPFNTGQDNRKSRKWWPWLLNRGRNYSTSREVIFGTLKTDHLIEGDRLIWRRLIQIRLLQLCYC